MKPGLVRGMDDETYHADPVPGGSLSSTLARLLTEHVPAKANVRRHRKATKSMTIGKAAHAHALGAGPQLIVWQHDGRTKAGKAERAEAEPLLETEAAVAVSATERDQILGMVTALRADERVAAILDEAESEVSGFAQDETGVWLRSRYDLLAENRSHDYKTCQDASRRGFSRAMASYGYHQQAEFYQRILRLLGHPAARRPMRFICQETEPPYLVQIHTCDSEAVDLARELNDRAIHIFAEAMRTSVWPGYAELVAEPTSLPNYYYYDLEDALPESWRGPAEVELKLS